MLAYFRNEASHWCRSALSGALACFFAGAVALLCAFVCVPIQAVFASETTNAGQQERTLLYIPDEPATIFWERDLGVLRKEVTGCENLNQAADWIDLCKNLLGLSPTFVNLTLGDTPRSAQNPRLRLTLGRRKILVTFLPVVTQRTTQRAALAPSPIVTKQAQTGDLLCDPNLPKRSPFASVRVEWKVARRGAASTQLIEESTLSERVFEGASEVSCATVLFDGILFLKRESNVHPSLFASSGPIDAAPLELQPDTLELFNTSTLIGKLQMGEVYGCRTLWPEGEGPDPCKAFESTTGRFSTRLFTEANVIRGLRGPAIFQIELTRMAGGDVHAKVAVPLFVDSGPQAKRSALSLSLVRDTLTEHLECRGPEGGMLLEPVQWKADGETISGWQQSYLPAFLLAAGAKYTCHLDTSFSEPLLYDDTQDAFRAPAEIHFPKGSTSLLFQVHVPPFRRARPSSSQPLFGCKASSGFECEKVADDSENSGTVLFRLNREKQRQEREQSDTKPQVLLQLQTENGTIERVLPIFGEGSSLFSEAGTPKEIPLAFSNQAWNCGFPSSTQTARVESVRWYLGHEEVKTARDRSSFSPPEVNAPKSLVCVIVLSQTHSSARSVAFGQTLLMPRAPTFKEISKPLVVLSDGNIEFAKGLVFEGAPLQRVQCVIQFPETGIERALDCALRTENLSVSLSRDDVSFFRKTIFQQAKVDPFAPQTALLTAVFSTQEYEFSLRSFVELLLPNRSPKLHLFSHYIDSSHQTNCVAIVTDPETNHVSLTLSPRFHARSGKTFTTREKKLAVASLQGLLSPTDGASSVASFGPMLVARTALSPEHDDTGLHRSGCRALVSDGTSLFEAFSEGSTEHDVRAALLTRLHNDSQAHVKLADNPPPPPFFPQGRPVPQWTQPNVFEVSHVKAHFDTAGTHDLLLPPGTSPNLRLLSCDGPRLFCSALFVSNGRLRLSLTSSVPGATAFVQLENLSSPKSRTLLVADVSNGTFTPLETSSIPSCQELLLKQSHGALPSYLHLSTFGLVKNGNSGPVERAVPASRVVAALSAGAEDVVCEAALHWAGKTLAIRSSSLKETAFFAPRRRNTGVGFSFSVSGVLPSQPPRNAPFNAQLSLLSLVSAIEAETREFAASFVAVDWKAKRCRVETVNSQTDCRIDPVTLLVYDLPKNFDFTLEATVEHRVMGRLRTLRVAQSFRGRPSLTQTLLPSVVLKRNGQAVECTLAGDLPPDTSIQHEFRLNSAPLAFSDSKNLSHTLGLSDEQAAFAGVLSCHVTWPGGSESAFLPMQELPKSDALNGICIVDQGTIEGPWATKCTWPEVYPLNDARARNDETLRSHLIRSLNLTRASQVKAIFSSRDAALRSSFLLSAEEHGTDTPLPGGLQEGLLLLPWTTERGLCLASNSPVSASDVPLGRRSRETHASTRMSEPNETALSQGLLRSAKSCTLLHSQGSLSVYMQEKNRNPVPLPVFKNDLGLGQAGPTLPPPFIASKREVVSRSKARLSSFFSSLKGTPFESSTQCLLRCRGADTHPARQVCEAALSELLADNVWPASDLKCERAETEPTSADVPFDVAVLELLWKKRDTPSMLGARVVGLVIP